jgi:hypothetical protein
VHADAIPLVSRCVEEFLADLKRRLPDTELRIMTGMAQGADLLVARAAVKAGWKVDAVLPMALERYMEDFDATSGAALRELLADPAVSCTVLPPPPGADPNAAHGAGRAVFYANLTHTLTAKCNLLLALWDGRTSRLAGGTADTVLRYLGARTHTTIRASISTRPARQPNRPGVRILSTGCRRRAAMVLPSRASQAI